VVALERVGSDAALVPLIASLSDRDGGVRNRAAAAIGRLWTGSTVDIVVELLGNQDAGTREAALAALVRMGIKGVPEMERALEDAEPDIEAAGREAIGRILLNERVMRQIGALQAHELLQARWGALGNPSIVVALVGGGVDSSVPDVADALIGETNHIQDTGEPHVSTTMSARLIAGKPDSDVVGVAPGVQLLSERVLGAGGGEYETVAAGIRHAAQEGAKIIYLDLGGPDDDEKVRQAVEAARASGCLIVAPAGNNNNETEEFPAALDGVLAVAATDAEDRKAPWSSYGSWVGISAPGNPVAAERARAAGFTQLQGTSFAGALVAGAAALVWSVDPSLSGEQIEEALLGSADSIDEANPSSLAGKLGSGRLQVLKAVQNTQSRS
jgi:subtilisin family serine protease